MWLVHGEEACLARPWGGVCACVRGGVGREMGAKHRTQNREVLLMLVVGWQASPIRGMEAGCSFWQLVAAHSAVYTFNFRQLSDLISIFELRDESS